MGGGQSQTVHVGGDSGGGLGCGMLLALLVAGAVCVAVLLSMATAASGVASVKQAEAAAIGAETARQVALAQAETARLQAEAALLRSAQEGAALAEGVRIVAGGLAVAIMAGAFYVILSHRERRRQDPRDWPGEVVDVTPELQAPSMPLALPAARPVVTATHGRRVRVGAEREG